MSGPLVRVIVGRSSSPDARVAAAWAVLAAVACAPRTASSPVDAAPPDVPKTNHADGGGSEQGGASQVADAGASSGSGGRASSGSGGGASGGSASGGSGASGSASGGRGSGSSAAGSGGSGSGGSGLGGRDSGGSGAGGHGTGGASGGMGAGGATAAGRGFPVGQPWVAFYGSPTSSLDLARVAAAFRIIDIDADPDVGFTTAQIAQLRSAGQNRVISYMNVGACENFRSYWDQCMV